MCLANVNVSQSSNVRSANSLYENSNDSLDIRRLEFEIGSTGDHDLPYEFTLPPSMPQTLAWAELLAKVYKDELEP